MKNVLLGSVAGLAMVGTAAAADLPVKAKAAEYVKICSTYGAGFYYVPGTDTCLKIGGYVTADTYATGGENKFVTTGADGYAAGTYKDSGSETYFLTRGAIQLDARTQTEYGTLRSYIEARFTYGNTGGIANEFSNDQTPTTSDYGGRSGTSTELKYAYIQFAGFTFGRATSAFDFWAGDFWYGIQPGAFYSDTTTNLVSYTADFGNGFSATLSVEDGYAREASYDYVYWTPTENDNQTVPDIVANVAYEGTWGALKLSGAYHDLQQLEGIQSQDSSGWAFLAGVRFDIAETTTLYIEGAYASGAVGYTGLGDYVPEVDSSGNAVSTWYIGGALQHYWTPTVFTSVVGSYSESDTFDVASGSGSSYDFDGTASWTGYNVGANIGWQPVKGLTLVLQYDYLDAQYDFGQTGGSSSLDYTQNRVTFSAKRAF
ncbi:porin [Ancylobacter lacus]|uniref:porin n=1 Tax=Ancylobacter lacus TaxID=2579970 RepID=UPI001BD0D478|nr:porin [Ancylobacter lacus]MBS7540934.1 porin [Ancylobacter lacus]